MKAHCFYDVSSPARSVTTGGGEVSEETGINNKMYD